MAKGPSVHLILVLVQFCFASLAVVGRLALADVSPNALVMARVAGGALVFWALARLGGPLGWRGEDLRRLVVCALLGVVVNQLLFVNGLARTTAVNASVLTTTIPPFTAAFAVAAGVERWQTSRFAGIVLALVGALVLVGLERVSGARAHALGNAMVLVNCISYAGFLVLVRPLAARYRPMALVAMLFGCAVVLVAPLGLVSWAEFLPRATARDAGLLAFIVAVPTVAAYALNQLAIGRAESSLVAVYVYLQPVFASLGALPLLGERPGPRTALAATLIFAGVWLSARRAPTTSPDG